MDYYYGGERGRGAVYGKEIDKAHIVRIGVVLRGHGEKWCMDGILIILHVRLEA
jgi:hypothetical protein